MYPVIAVDAAELTPEQYEIARGVIATAGPNKGRLRASRPTHLSGDTQYVWRMLAFFVSPNGIHHSMPVMADFYIDVPDEIEEQGYHIEAEWRRNRCKELDEIVTALERTVPANMRWGTLRWGRVLGFIG